MWNAELQRNPGAHTAAFGLAADGEIIRMDEELLSCNGGRLSYQSLDHGTPARTTARWEEWCSGMDGFGGLVMLAASLVA